MELLDNEHIRAITNILHKLGERIEGNLICNRTPSNFTINDNIDKIRNLQYLCKNKKKIMEIGINACHSLLIMLLINPNAEYLLFDLNYHTYTIPTLNYIKEKFPGTKINVVFGDSVETINQYILNNPDELNTYDLIHLDGGHTEDIFSQDYKNSKCLISKGGVVIFDDYNMSNIYNFINQKVNENEIIEYNDINITKNNLHFIFTFV